MVEKLSPHDLEQACARLPQWHLDDARRGLERELKFDDFNAAFGFMSRVALKAEQLNNHTEWRNV